MEPYIESEAFKRLRKLAELKKIVLGNIEDVKSSDKELIPESIREDLRMRGACPIPKEVLDASIDDGMDATIAHMAKHKAMMLPGEALYHAIGKKDRDVYDSSIKMSLSDILEMIINRPVVSQTQPDHPMELDDFDMPKHVKIIVRMRGISPNMLEKSARDHLGTMEMLDGLQFTYMNGSKESIGAKYAKDHKKEIEKLINDGIIIKVIKILSSGMKTTIYDKTASSDIEDLLFIEMLCGIHKDNV